MMMITPTNNAKCDETGFISMFTRLIWSGSGLSDDIKRREARGEYFTKKRIVEES